MTVQLYGELISDEWDWIYSYFEIPHCCPMQVREAIKQLPEGEDLIVEINCPGGDVWAGFEIFGLLQACSAHTEAHIIAMAASAATTVTSGCDTVLASPVAQVMVHQPSARGGYLNNDGARELVQFLDSVRASIINGYVIKAAGKTPRARFEELVDNSTWMPVQDAIALGLVDGLLDADEDAAQRITASGGVVISNMASLSVTPQALLERYEAAVRAGTMDEAPGHPVTREAAHTLGKAADAINAVAHAVNAAADAIDKIGDAAESADSLIPDWQLQARIDLARARCKA